MKINQVVLLAALVLLLTTAIGLAQAKKHETYPLKPGVAVPASENLIYSKLVNGEPAIDWDQLEGSLKFIQSEYDCSDFRLVNLIRILYQFENEIPSESKQKIETVLFGFRYWWDEPGGNSMCYWSENHQILFASAEYLIGQKYPDTIFGNSGFKGMEHRDKARQRVLDWLKMRWDYGFSEFYSSVYYKEDIAALLNLIDFSEDEEVRIKSEIIMDLILYDIASQKCNSMFISASGRAYERNRKGGESGNFDGLTDFLWGNASNLKSAMMYGFKKTGYQLPPVLKAIGNDTSTVIIKQSNGLNLTELKSEDFKGTDNRSMMMQWGMEAFVNPSVVRSSLNHIRANRMFSNHFLKDFRKLDFALIRWLHLEPLLMKLLNLQAKGTVIQRGNTYTYKTADYSMYTVQHHQPGDFGSQHHIFGVNIDDHFAVYHTHPAASKGAKTDSPDYTVGYGYLPASVQDKNVNLSIYRLPKRKGWMEKELLQFTYAYFPVEKFDSALVDGNYAFGQKGDTYCAFIGKNNFGFTGNDTSELIQPGNQVFWVTLAGSKKQDGSFGSFIRKVKSSEVVFNERKSELRFRLGDEEYLYAFNEGLTKNTQLVETNYRRFDSPYIVADAKAERLLFSFQNDTLSLDFEKLKRSYTTP
ncbi:hypothetical protein [Mangrovibacterium sp.]|uniref:hypothetical protein n=1 Tax=Mangrovibacterium sp. TaxID=1961364 RepID=UPI003568137F